MRTNSGVTARLFASMLAAQRTVGLVLVGFSILALCVGGCGESVPTAPDPTPPSSPTPPPSPTPTLARLQGYVLGFRRLPHPAWRSTSWTGCCRDRRRSRERTAGSHSRSLWELPVTLRLRRDGYAEKQESIRVKSSDYRFVLNVIAFNFEPGNYLLRLSLDQSEATNSRYFPEAPCAGIPSEALTHQFNATVEHWLLAPPFNRVTLASEPMVHESALFYRGAGCARSSSVVGWSVINQGPWKLQIPHHLRRGRRRRLEQPWAHLVRRLHGLPVDLSGSHVLPIVRPAESRALLQPGSFEQAPRLSRVQLETGGDAIRAAIAGDQRCVGLQACWHPVDTPMQLLDDA